MSDHTIQLWEAGDGKNLGLKVDGIDYVPFRVHSFDDMPTRCPGCGVSFHVKSLTPAELRADLGVTDEEVECLELEVEAFGTDCEGKPFGSGLILGSLLSKLTTKAGS